MTLQHVDGSPATVQDIGWMIICTLGWRDGAFTDEQTIEFYTAEGKDLIFVHPPPLFAHYPLPDKPREAKLRTYIPMGTPHHVVYWIQLLELFLGFEFERHMTLQEMPADLQEEYSKSSGRPEVYRLRHPG